MSAVTPRGVTTSGVMNNEVMNSAGMNKELTEQLIDLQSRFAFQEDALQALSDIVARQQQQIDQLESALAIYRDRLAEALDAMATMAPGAAQGHEPPPHY